MHSRIQALVLPSEAAGFTEEVARLFAELGRSEREVAGECSPALDVYETDEHVAVVMDLPGVDAAAIRIIVKANTLVVAGEKISRRARGDSSFHLVERGFGRFARVIRLTAPCDAGRATATLARGELRIVIPKIPERRGQVIRVKITS
jgi:HSP20 family protein